MLRIRNRDVSYGPIKNCRIPRCSVTPPTPTLSSTAWSITPTGLTSTGKACGEPVNPAERPEPMALWTCRCAWTTRSALPTCPQQQTKKTFSRDLRLTTRLRRCQKPDSQNASRPGRHQIGMVGEIISESWARSNRYTRARSSESARDCASEAESLIAAEGSPSMPSPFHS